MKEKANFFYNLCIFLISLFTTSKKEEGPVRLNKPDVKKKRKTSLHTGKIDYKTLLFIIGVMIIFIIMSIIIFKTGSLESTGVYNNLSSRI